MEAGRGDDGAQRPEIPADIGVDEDRPQRQQRRGAGQDQRREAQAHRDGDLSNAGEQVVDRMQTHRGQPVELDRAVVHGVETPAPAA